MKPGSGLVPRQRRREGGREGGREGRRGERSASFTSGYGRRLVPREGEKEGGREGGVSGRVSNSDLTKEEGKEGGREGTMYQSRSNSASFKTFPSSLLAAAACVASRHEGQGAREPPGRNQKCGPLREGGREGRKEGG